MRMKLVKTGVNLKPGELYKKTFYEYTLLDDDQRDQLTRSYVNSLRQMEERSRTDEKYQLAPIPPIRIPVPSPNDIDDCHRIHADRGEEIIMVVKKTNNNYQFYVREPKEEPPDPLLCTICNSFTAKTDAGLSAHKRSCKIINS